MLNEEQAVRAFVNKFTMYVNVALEAHEKDAKWYIYIKDISLNIGFVDVAGTAFLEPI